MSDKRARGGAEVLLSRQRATQCHHSHQPQAGDQVSHRPDFFLKS